MNNNAYSHRSVLEPQVIVLRVSNLFMINYNYLLIDHISSASIIVDPAWDMDKIERALADSHTSLEGILLTHSHFDHVNLARPLAERYGCPIWMSREEITASGFDAPQLQVVPNDPFWVGHMKVVPMLTPGHTAGSMCYLIGNNLFSGDTLFAEGCGLCSDIPAAHAMFESLRLIRESIYPHTRIFPGHNYGKPPGQEFDSVLRSNIYLQFETKEDLAAYRLRKGQGQSRLFKFQ